MLIVALGYFSAFGVGIFGLVILGLWIWGLVDVMGRPDLDGAARIRWIALIVLLPIVGTLIYLAKRPTLPEERDKIIAAEMRRHQ
jgi:hypothetical protein